MLLLISEDLRNKSDFIEFLGNHSWLWWAKLLLKQREDKMMLCKFWDVNTQNLHSAGGVSDFFYYWNLNIFVSQEPMQNFRTLQQPLLGS